MPESQQDNKPTLPEQQDREQVRRLINESGAPAPVDMAVFSRRTGQIIAQAASSDRRN
jgi:hypothetical protein